jgi:predicted RNA-binding Zn-ribbon protein involved in translation (DUF1610 family)
MVKEPLNDEAEVEVICPRCSYHLTRTAARLRCGTPVVCPSCGEEVVPEGHGDSGWRTH